MLSLTGCSLGALTQPRSPGCNVSTEECFFVLCQTGGLAMAAAQCICPECRLSFQASPTAAGIVYCPICDTKFRAPAAAPANPRPAPSALRAAPPPARPTRPVPPAGRPAPSVPPTAWSAPPLPTALTPTARPSAPVPPPLRPGPSPSAPVG